MTQTETEQMLHRFSYTDTDCTDTYPFIMNVYQGYNTGTGPRLVGGCRLKCAPSLKYRVALRYYIYVSIDGRGSHSVPRPITSRTQEAKGQGGRRRKKERRT